MFVLIFKGTSGEGQANLFSNLIRSYIEETSASIITVSQSQNQLADINSLTALSGQNLGRGGEVSKNLDPSTVQENSLMASNPVATDYIEAGFTSNQIIEYTVQPGDLLSFIASDYGVSIDSILWANSLANANSIKPDQVLRIPPVSGVIHKVKSGDTVASIAKKYGATTDKILAFNHLEDGQSLELNEELIIPDGKIKSSVTTKPGTQTAVAKRFSYLPDLGDYFMIPTQGRTSQGIHGRNGVDKANPCGTPIYAAADGNAVTVDGVGYNGGFGQFIKLAHPNGTETLYAHASKLLITAGQNVAKGQLIALMGSTGRSTGCHLHFEVHGARNPLVKY
ncbi:MAG: Cell wall endopeptidase, family M23/M37 [Candidatus Yanofskybacteria bacterium GW2011_GWA1_39_13]|uniref:Cell wall endopeptidase, family M23/M37 n=1 Tax=Yanofskybacteria sp. (strain GW2011_GWA1_39_13) TaxID=1619019 RepID=A0A0G0MHN5_YANXG|nr:MAG: Cell wall endopeptidase, family M23/M37 [Candidatus Yanofskybacteria bacterium GW2011_GWA1_39_13]